MVKNIELRGALDLVAGSLLDAVVAIDGTGCVLAWNSTAERIFGWTAAEAMGRALTELIVPIQHRKSHDEGLTRYHDSGEARVLNRRIEITAIDKEGREFPIELSIVAFAVNPSPIFVGFLRDISLRRQAEDRLILSEESLRLTTEAAEIGIWDLDLRTQVLNWSDRTKGMFGISPEVVCSMDDFYAGLHPEDREITSKAFADALDPAIRSTYDVQYRTVGKEDGITRWVAAKGKGLFTEDGQCIRAVGTAIDISARKLEDERHAFMLELSDRLTAGEPDDALNDVCALLGKYFGVPRVGYGQLNNVEDVFDCTFCWTDGLARPLLGRYPARAFGDQIIAQLHRGETVVISDLLSDPLSGQHGARGTMSNVDTRAMLVVPVMRFGRLNTLVYLNDRAVREWRTDEISLLEDVAQRTRQVYERGAAEAALRALNLTLEARVEERTAQLKSAEDVLRQAQKMDAIGQLTGGIAHDFNNLLQGISSSLDLMQKRISQRRYDELERFMSGAMTATSRAAALTHRLLAFARRQPLDPRPVRPNPLISSMEDMLRRTLGERIELTLKFAHDVWITRCDSNQLESAILNLAINARDAMPDGGKLVIGTSNVAETDRINHHGSSAPGEFICVSVSDTGTGMSEDTIAKAFEPFFTTKPMGQGTGLGLSMIYGFAKQSDGDVTIRSQVGEGTTVHLYLPRFHGEVTLNSGTVEKLDLTVNSGNTILVIEDEAVVRGLIVDALTDLGYVVSEAADGISGLELLRSSNCPDLLITDIGLPGLNGRQVADAARQLYPGLKVLFMTGYADAVALQPGFLEPGLAMITKPFAIDALVSEVVGLIESE